MELAMLCQKSALTKSFEKRIGWPTECAGINMRFSRDEADAWYATIQNHMHKLATGALPSRT